MLDTCKQKCQVAIYFTALLLPLFSWRVSVKKEQWLSPLLNMRRYTPVLDLFYKLLEAFASVDIHFHFNRSYEPLYLELVYTKMNRLLKATEIGEHECF